MSDTTREELEDEIKASYYRASGGVHNIADVETERTMKLIQAEITKAQEQLLDELEDESIEEMIVILGHTKMIKKIPFSAIEDKRKELKEEDGKA